MSATKQDLLYFKEENQKLKENFKKFLKKHESNKKYIAKDKVKEFIEEQEILIHNLDKKIDKIIVIDEKIHSKPAQKRKIFETSPTQNENQAPKRPHMEPEIMKNSLENFFNNSGLQHLAENIFSYLHYKDLDACQLVNRSSKSILGNPKFWLRKFVQRGMSKKNQNNWINAIQLAKETDFERNLQLYLKRSLWKAKIIDIPCYIDENILQKSSELIKEFGNRALIQSQSHQRKNGKYTTAGFIQALAAIQMHRDKGLHDIKDWAVFNNTAAACGNLEIIKIVSPLMDNPNANWDENGDDRNIMFTPIYSAAINGHLEIVKYLVEHYINNLNLNAFPALVNGARRHPHVGKYIRSLDNGIFFTSKYTNNSLSLKKSRTK